MFILLSYSQFNLIFLHLKCNFSLIRICCQYFWFSKLISSNIAFNYAEWSHWKELLRKHILIEVLILCKALYHYCILINSSFVCVFCLLRLCFWVAFISLCLITKKGNESIHQIRQFLLHRFLRKLFFFFYIKLAVLTYVKL